MAKHADNAEGCSLSPDPWLSNLLQKPAFTLSVPTAGVRVDALPQGPCFVTAKVKSGDIETIHALEDVGFRVTDASVLFSLPAASMPQLPFELSRIRPATPADEDRVVDIAKSSFQHSRFHLDPKIPNALADRIKGAWVANFFRGQRGDEMIVSCGTDETIRGFVQILKPKPSTAIIDLIATAPEAQRSGDARRLVSAMADDLRRNGSDGSLLAGTQLANQAACRFYQSLQFQLIGSGITLHFHGQ